MSLVIFGILLPWLFVGLCGWVGCQLVRQNGRILLQLEAMEQRFARLQAAPLPGQPAPAAAAPQGLPIGSPAPSFDLIDEHGRIASAQAVGAEALLALRDGAPTPVPANGNGHAALGGTRTLAESKIPRSGLLAGTPAPGFILPRLEGGELSLEEFRGQKVLLVFSDPNCGPCMALAPQLEQAHRRSAEVQVLIVSRGEIEANREKVQEYGLSFPVALQKQWEVSRDYAIFATPVAYLIDEAGVLASDAAVGVEPILGLLSRAALPTNGRAAVKSKKGNGREPALRVR
jgi:peroxiredoxin